MKKQDLFKWKHYQPNVIVLTVRWYLRYNLSFRDLVEMMEERGLFIAHTTIMRWVHEYGNLIYQIWKKKNKSAHFAWHLDETYIKVKGEWCYLYRAIDQEGYILDIQLRKTRNHQAAYMFMKRLIKAFGEPTVVTTDKAPALLCAFKKLKNNGFYVHTKHCTVKHFNNLIEQDHRHVKRRLTKSSGFQNIRHASRTIKGIETLHALYKQKRNLSQDFVFSAYQELQQLMAIA
ncbi:IS6 family transposase [Bacillus pseudomycoides]|uniref:IS6 family transposase n=1 Tax=Bacillus pseudomycoides TaxID=64104 RepID=UPI0001A14256|nr:IS6 family transposase [Bacillus pseudomycoides]EEM01721.1 Transposase for insertion sequence element IS257 in transposon Tn4003 [Bacillus pseudomycoides]EEM08023.1 Transposase for insertion sequence element IS257 in transposon Tn4003 [Bacillus pseudomycoides]PDZ12699.1 IS6 family transposase [Bacillus pseudomycoides]PDZ70601.1 IS6 family transposase [Bacillus pseudomycoides]PEF22040.1 IS6 family transposase [Bacillus pseudomycoides]